MVICLEQGADLHMVQLMPLPLAVSCFSKIQIGFTFLALAYLGCPGKRAVKRVYVCIYLFVNTATTCLEKAGNWPDVIEIFLSGETVHCLLHVWVNDQCFLGCFDYNAILKCICNR